MIRYQLILCLVLSSLAFAGSPRSAQVARQKYDAQMSAWVKAYENSRDLNSRESLLEKRPDDVDAAKLVWREIYRDLGKDWTMPYAAWILRTSPRFANQVLGKTKAGVPLTPLSMVTKAISDHHIKSAEIGGCCVGLSISSDPRVQTLLEKVKVANTHEHVQGQAALGLSLIQKRLGQDPGIMKMRIANIREAIEKCDQVQIGTTTVVEVAAAELYEIKYLLKGRVGPNLAGQSEMKRAMELKQFRGQIVVLFFWSSRMSEADRVLGIMRDLTLKNKGRNVKIVGVTEDPLATVRKYRAEEKTPWSSFVDSEGSLLKSYQVKSLPMVYVLDEQGIIYHKEAAGAFTEMAVEALVQRAIDQKKKAVLPKK